MHDLCAQARGLSSAAEGIARSVEAGTSLLNGFPAVNHGLAECRRVVEALTKPVQVRHGTPDARLLGEITLAAGFTVGHEGQIGGAQGRFAYFETAGHPGTVIEISDVSGSKGRFFQYISDKAAAWDGSDPVRAVRP